MVVVETDSRSFNS